MRYSITLLLLVTLMFACKETTRSVDANTKNDPSKIGKLIAGAKKGKTPEGGYEYIHHVQHEGPRPTVGDEVRYHEIVFLNDSLVKSTHYGFEPTRAVLPAKELVSSPPPPSYEAIQLMTTGDSMTLIQYVSDFDEKDIPKWLKKGDVLRYEMQLVSYRPASEVAESIFMVKAREKTVGDSLKMRIEQYKKGALGDALKTTESGLKYLVHDPGEGAEINKGKFLQVHYYGALMDGTPYDNTYKNARPFAFQIGRGRVIQGWDDGMVNVKKGGKVTLFIPYQLAYGEAGKPAEDDKTVAVPEKADIAFYIEVLDVR